MSESVSREECLRRAADAERLSQEADTEATREQFLAQAIKWRALADAPSIAPPFDRADHKD